MASGQSIQLLLHRQRNDHLLKELAERLQVEREEVDLLLRHRIRRLGVDDGLRRVLQSDAEGAGVGVDKADDAGGEAQRRKTSQMSAVKLDDEVPERSCEVVAARHRLADDPGIGLEAGNASLAQLEEGFDGSDAVHEGRQFEDFLDVRSAVDVGDECAAVVDDAHVREGVHGAGQFKRRPITKKK